MFHGKRERALSTNKQNKHPPKKKKNHTTISSIALNSGRPVYHDCLSVVVKPKTIHNILQYTVSNPPTTMLQKKGTTKVNASKRRRFNEKKQLR
jgi:hypothetical protein